MAVFFVKHPVMKLNVGGRHYFGEVRKDNGKYRPGGIGLYTISENSFVMSEHATEEELSGMALIGSGISGFVTYNENGVSLGPRLHFNDEDDILFDYKNRLGYKERFAITIKKDGTYYISQYDRLGNFTNKVLSFKKSLFCLEYRISEDVERTAVAEKRVGWDFKYPFVRMYLMPYEEKSVAPARIESLGSTYTYFGGAQTSSLLFVGGLKKERQDDFNYVKIVEANLCPDREIFSDLSKFGYGINFYGDGRVYFGEVFDDKFGGIGCMKYPGYDYLGYLCHTEIPEPDRTGMKVYPNGVIEFGSFTGSDNVIFEIHDDFLYIKSYHKDKHHGSYYKLYFDSFDLEEYTEDGSLSESIPFPEVTEEMKSGDDGKVVIKTKLTGADLLDNDERKSLSNFDYNVPRPNSIAVYNFKNERMTRVGVPDCVTKIDEGTFRDKDKIEELFLPENLKHLEYGSLVGMKNLTKLHFNEKSLINRIPGKVCDSPKLREVVLPVSVTRISSEAFIACYGLKKAYVYEKCEIGIRAFPKRCKIIYLDKDGRIIKKGKKSKENEKGEKKSSSANKGSSRTRVRNRRSFDFSDTLKGALGVLAYPFRAIFNFFSWLFGIVGEGVSALGTATNIFSIISIVVLIATVIMNHFEVNGIMNEWAADTMQIILGSIKLHLSGLVYNWMDTMYVANFGELLIWLFAAILIVVCFFLDLVIGLVTVIGFLLFFALFIVLGYAYFLIVPAGMLALAIIGLVNDRSATNIVILIIDVCLSVLFYLVFYI